MADAWFSQFASDFVPERPTLATALIFYRHKHLQLIAAFNCQITAMIPKAKEK